MNPNVFIEWLTDILESYERHIDDAGSYEDMENAATIMYNEIKEIRDLIEKD